MRGQSTRTPVRARNPQIASRSRPGLNKLSLQRLYHTRSVGSGRWSPDGRRLCFASNASGRQNLWIMDSTGGWPLQLTVSDQRQIAGGWSPDGKWITFQSDYDGNEQWDLFAVSTATGETRNLTRTPEISEEDPRWSPDGRWLAYVSKPKTGASYEIHVMDFAGGPVREITSGTPAEYSNSGPVWSPDGRRLAFTQTRADQKKDILLVAELKSGLIRRVSPEGGEHNYYAADWSPDGRRLLITSNALNRFSNVGLLDPECGAIEWITRETWDCEAGEFRGRFITYESNVDGNSRVYLFDIRTRRRKAVGGRDGLSTLGSEVFSPDGKRVLFSASGPTAPTDLYTCAATGSAGRIRPVRATHSALAAMDPNDMVPPYLVHYSSRDGLEISAFLYVPYNLKKNRRNPAIVYVHGGPSAQYMNGFNRSVQYLVNNGYVVIAPNYRGSTGYGKDFEERNRFDMGGGDLHDVVEAARFAARTGFVDPGRIAIMGGSYGGYMTMMGLTKRPEVWAAGVAIVPFVNWFTELEHEDPSLREWDLATMGDPVANRLLYEDRSPIYSIGNIRAPLLVLAGGNDPRCPKEESDQVVRAIESRGGVVEYKFYEEEGHSFSRLENSIDSFERTVAFLDKHMR
ncbi:MAG TPA: S9 family peptidase [Bryobacteraceae bacterium]|nr:S9 family peptidase [Bryobacteraceae bacterium]